MSRHEGVSCDECKSANFTGLRYKCLKCYDVDFCARCHDADDFIAQPEHTSDHPVQVILTRSDFGLYYGGEVSSGNQQVHSLTCPVCGRLGFTKSDLVSHANREHQDYNEEAICPICATTPGEDSNTLTTDITTHMILEHGLVEERPSVQFQDPEPFRVTGNASSRLTQRFGRGRGMSTSLIGPSLPPGVDPGDEIDEFLAQMAMTTAGPRRSAHQYTSSIALPAASRSQYEMERAAQALVRGSAVFNPSAIAFQPRAQRQENAAAAAAPAVPLSLTVPSSVPSCSHTFLLDKHLLDSYSQTQDDINPDAALFFQDILLASMSLQEEVNNGTGSSSTDNDSVEVETEVEVEKEEIEDINATTTTDTTTETAKNSDSVETEVEVEKEEIEDLNATTTTTTDTTTETAKNSEKESKQ